MVPPFMLLQPPVSTVVAHGVLYHAFISSRGSQLLPSSA
jgi:hypothetical protein